MTTPPSEPHDLEATAQLLSLASDGDEAARNQLVARFLPILNRWAHGRLPSYARDLSDTADLVQVSLLRALNNLDNFESRGEGAFLAYLRQILINAVRDEIRRTMRRPGHGPLFEQLTDQQPSALERTIGRERMDLYEAGLERLEERQRQAILLRFEFGYSHAEVAAAIGAPSPNAARMVVARAVLSLSEVLEETSRPGGGN
ncbi:MAG: sigma-70 family RNA polymerase sigma factor [Thermoanaerobaculia bacterium]|nr:sigma-70 family RNA polymerase sigma factor [Thermoanaerobaculia bacterium]